MNNGAKTGKYPWFPFYPADFLTDENVVMMSAAEVGVYVQLLCHAWKEGSVPDNRRQLARMARVTEDELEGMWPALAPCFTASEPGRLVNPRLEEERQRLDEKSESARRSAAARWDPEKRKKRASRGRKVQKDEALMRSQSEGNARAHQNASANDMRSASNGELELHANGSGDHAQVTSSGDVMRTHSGRNANGMLSESESEEKKDTNVSSSAKPKKSKTKGETRAHPLPEDWRPTTRHAEIAAEELVDLDREAERMRNWARGKGEKRKDWDAVFTNWLRAAYERGGYRSRPRASGAPTGTSSRAGYAEDQDPMGWLPIGGE